MPYGLRGRGQAHAFGWPIPAIRSHWVENGARWSWACLPWDDWSTRARQEVSAEDDIKHRKSVVKENPSTRCKDRTLDVSKFITAWHLVLHYLAVLWVSSTLFQKRMMNSVAWKNHYWSCFSCEPEQEIHTAFHHVQKNSSRSCFFSTKKAAKRETWKMHLRQTRLEIEHDLNDIVMID